MSCAVSDRKRLDFVDVPAVLEDLFDACVGPLEPSHRRNLDAICRKLAVTGTLLARYDRDWKPSAIKTPLDAHHWPLVGHVLLSWADALADADRPFSLKLLNAALAATDIASLDGDLRAKAKSRVDAMVVSTVADNKNAGRPATGTPRTLPLTVLAYEGPCARAYLSMMRRAGLRPQRIMLLVLNEHPQSHKAVGRWFPGCLRTWYAEKAQDAALNYWPRRIRAAHPELVRSITDGLQGTIERPGEIINEMYGPFHYESYADQVERVSARNVQSSEVYDAIEAGGAGTILFTGGGLLPARTIDIPGTKYLHVHPGHLPHVRGADGLLWSMLVNGRPSMSCFHLASGLDTGDIVAVRDYARPHFKLARDSRPDDQTLYRAIFAFVDPLLRANLLVNDVLSRAGDLTRLPTATQDAAAGVTYHFMHPALRRQALEALFSTP